MGSIVHRSVPTNLKWFPTCSHAHAMFQDRFKDVQVGSRWFSTLYILSPNFHIRAFPAVCLREGLVSVHARTCHPQTMSVVWFCVHVPLAALGFLMCQVGHCEILAGPSMLG